MDSTELQHAVDHKHFIVRIILKSSFRIIHQLGIDVTFDWSESY